MCSPGPGGPDRSIFWLQGARLSRGDYLPIEELFEHDLVIVDVDDPDLRRLLVDLPMHVSPRTRLLGTLTYLVQLAPEDGLELALRHDYLVGNERELMYLTGTDRLDEAAGRVQREMVLSQTRFAALSRGARGCLVVDRRGLVEVPAFPIDAVDTTGAGDAFAAGVALAILERRPLREVGLLGNAMGALASRLLGARASLPGRAELDEFIRKRNTLRSD